MTAVAEHIKRMMGWCPNVNSKTYKSNQPIDFANMSINPSDKTINIQKVKSDNVIFPANTFMITIFVIGVSLLVDISRNLDYSILFAITAALYTSFYFIGVKSLQGGILIDESGVHLKSFRLRDITLNYKDIKSIKSFKWEVKRYSKKTYIAVMGILLVVFAILVMLEEWRLIILIALLLPLTLLLYREQKLKGCMNTQLYIESRKKKWYELSPYYSVITDQVTASGIQAAIEHYRGVK